MADEPDGTAQGSMKPAEPGEMDLSNIPGAQAPAFYTSTLGLSKATYQQDLSDDLKSDEYAAAYIGAAAKDSPEALKAALCDVSNRPVPHKCPVCEGARFLSKAESLAGRGTPSWQPTDADYSCPVCDGKGVLWG
jgi:hypothetical protein